MFFKEHQRFSKLLKSTHFSCSPDWLCCGWAGVYRCGRDNCLTRPELANPSNNYFNPQETCRACLHILVFCSGSPWPEGLRIDVSKQNNKKSTNQNLPFKINRESLAEWWICTVTRLPKTWTTLPARKKPPITRRATLWPKWTPGTVLLTCPADLCTDS